MISTLIVERDKLMGIIDIENLTGTLFRVTISPLSEAEIDDAELFFASTFCIKLQNIFVGCCKTVL